MDSETAIIITIIIAALAMAFTGWGVVHQVKESVKKEKKELQEWKTEREKTDDSQNNTLEQHNERIRGNAEKIKQNEIDFAKHKKEVDAKFLTVEKKIADNYSALMQATNDSIKELIPVIKERDEELYNKLITAINSKDALDKEKLKAIWNELDKKTNRRVKK